MSAKPSRGLGRGLDALLPKVEKGGVQQLLVAQLRPSPFQPRQKMDEAGIAELADSIARKGVLQPIVARPVDGGYEIVAGERRFRAAQRAGLTSVPATVRELSDQETLEIAVVENLQREDLNPMDEARAFKLLLDFGMNQERVAEAVGKSRSAIANALRLLALPEEAQAAIESGAISAGHARAILAQPEPDRLWALGEIVRRELTVREAEGLKRPTARSSQRKAAGRYARLEEDLSRFAGTRVRIAGSGKNGRIELHFHSEDELQRILELLGYES
ncbi:MAG: ParB/RepB/Spo0J family partition protein [Trueperaceae bacterium]|nr:ParB/RepB/Spo0J family partition protein [Trueperaceae bacterium]MCO5174510.1 ParB/RepB/Spo0J family partition protein [Trueperaceae bacterium]MCW5818264.1 ParB/RepB/Spo0J family partition protein [Trueperaceae bacterium]